MEGTWTELLSSLENLCTLLVAHKYRNLAKKRHERELQIYHHPISDAMITKIEPSECEACERFTAIGMALSIRKIPNRKRKTVINHRANANTLDQWFFASCNHSPDISSNRNAFERVLTNTQLTSKNTCSLNAFETNANQLGRKQREFRCNICSFSCVWPFDLKQHLKQKHKIV